PTPFGFISLAGMAPAALLVLDADAVDRSARPLLDLAGVPALDIAGDVDAFDLGIGGAAAAARLLLQVVGDIHLVGPALVLRLGGAVAPPGRRVSHGSTPPLLVVVCLRPDMGSAAVDLPGGTGELLLPGLAKVPRFRAELLLPRWGMRQRDEVARSLVQLGEGRARVGTRHVAADVLEDSSQTRLAVYFAVDVSVFGHGISSFLVKCRTDGPPFPFAAESAGPGRRRLPGPWEGRLTRRRNRLPGRPGRLRRRTELGLGWSRRHGHENNFFSLSRRFRPSAGRHAPGFRPPGVRPPSRRPGRPATRCPPVACCHRGPTGGGSASPSSRERRRPHRRPRSSSRCLRSWHRGPESPGGPYPRQRLAR